MRHRTFGMTKQPRTTQHAMTVTSMTVKSEDNKLNSRLSLIPYSTREDSERFGSRVSPRIS